MSNRLVLHHADLDLVCGIDCVMKIVEEGGPGMFEELKAKFLDTFNTLDNNPSVIKFTLPSFLPSKHNW